MVFETLNETLSASDLAQVGRPAQAVPPPSPTRQRSIESYKEQTQTNTQLEFPSAPPHQKRCRSCLKEKLLDEFSHYDLEAYSTKSQPLFCAPCFRKNRERLKATLGVRFRHIKKQAKKRRIDFSLTLADVSILAGKPCFYCGNAMERLSLDRVDSLQGYSAANVVPCCFWCNSMKNAFSVEKFIERCRLIASRFSGRHGQ